jgi:hypothetical protein
MNQRLTVYRRLASARSLDEITALLDEMRDRYGAPPASVENLAQYARIRLMADRIGLETLDREGTTLVLKFRPDAKVDPVLLAQLVEARGDLVLLPPAVLRLDVSRPEAVRREAAKVAVPRGARLVKAPRATVADQPPSWWTARAKAAVEPGFTKTEILAETPPDPSQPGGLFERLGALLDQLSRSMVTG